jgi:competence protein ComEA
MRFSSSPVIQISKNSVTTFCILLVAFSTACRRSPTNVALVSDEKITSASNAININTASKNELQQIPYVGEKLAEKIIEHRKVQGPFRKVEHLMLIQGISDKRFRKIRPAVKVE